MLGAIDLKELVPHEPNFEFRPRLDTCPLCGLRLTVSKTLPKRRVATMHLGSFNARVVELSCRDCKQVYRSEDLAAIVPAGANFGYDVIEFVGRQIYCNHRSALSVVEELKAQRITISESRVRDLASSFVAYLAIAHQQATPRIAAHLQGNGGYILHLDSTSRGRSLKLLVAVDSLSDFVLFSVKLRRETGEAIADFLTTIFERYGKPLAIVADMAAAIRCARLKVAASIPLFVCHFHFLRDAGCDLMKVDYQRLRRTLKATDVYQKLRKLLAQLDPVASEHSAAIENALLTLDTDAELPIEALEPEALLVVLLMCAQAPADAGDGLGFPFDRVWVNYADALLRVRNVIETLHTHVAMPPRAKRRYARALVIVNEVQAAPGFEKLLETLQRHGHMFDQLRAAFRIAEPEHSSGYATVETTHSRDQVKPCVQAIRDRLFGQEEYQKLVEQLDRHWEGLFREPIQLSGENGQVQWLHPARTNNVMEHLFGNVSRASHHRTGVSFTERNLNAMLPDVPVLRNLANPVYMDLLLDGADCLADRFAKIASAEVRHYLKAHCKRGLFSHPQRVRKILLKPATGQQLGIYALTCEVERLA